MGFPIVNYNLENLSALLDDIDTPHEQLIFNMDSE